MVGSHVRLGYVRYRQGRYDSALASFAREQAFLAEHDHALKGRLQIEILQKQGAAYWRKGDREASDRAFADDGEGVPDPPVARRRRPIHQVLRRVAVRAARRRRRRAALPRRMRRGRPALTRVRARLDPDFEALREIRAFRALVDGDAVAAQARVGRRARTMIARFHPSVRGVVLTPFHKEFRVDVQDPRLRYRPRPRLDRRLRPGARPDAAAAPRHAGPAAAAGARPQRVEHRPGALDRRLHRHAT